MEAVTRSKKSRAKDEERSALFKAEFIQLLHFFGEASVGYFLEAKTAGTVWRKRMNMLVELRAELKHAMMSMGCAQLLCCYCMSLGFSCSQGT